MVAVTLALAASHADVDLGSLPAWVSAVGAMFTAGGVLVALQSYRSTRLSDLEDQANQVRLLRVSWLPAGIENGKQRWRTEFKNRSRDPLYNIVIHGFRAKVEAGEPSVLMRPIVETFLDGDRRRGPVKTAGDASISELPSGEFVRQLWEVDSDSSSAPVGHYTAIWYSVMDANGRYWNVADNYEPTKIPRPERPLL